MTFKIEPSSQALGTFISGIDLRAPLNEASIADLQRIWGEHPVMIFRGQELSDADLLRFSGYFGECDSAPVGDALLNRDIPPEITVISNVKENGAPIGFLGTGELIWHTDMSYNPEPAIASGLYALDVTKGAGGETSYLNMYAAFEALPPALLARIKDRSAIHDSSYTSAGTLRTGMPEVTDVAKAPGAHHPLLRTHPTTGRTALFLGRRPNAYILGLPVEESEALLDEIWAHTMQDRFVYTHRWERGDLVFWDNRCVMHRREAFDDSEHRIMHRTQLKGEAPYFAG
jgi:taurine dioxygenase